MQALNAEAMGATISIYNVNGQLVQTHTVTTTEMVISTAELLAGMYYLNIQNDQFTAIEKLMIQR